MAAVYLLGAGSILRAQIPQAPQVHGPSVASLEEAKQRIDAADFSGAAVLLSKYLEANRGSVKAHEMLAYSYLRLNDPKRSLEEYTSAAAIERPTAVDLENVAKDYILLDDTASAEHWMKRAVQMNDRDADAWYGLGRIELTLQRFQEAADCFQRSLALLPNTVKTENNLGLAYEGLNRTDDAIAAYRQAIAWQQDDAHPSEQPLLNLGIILVHEDKLDEAQALLTKAMEIAPRDPRIREQLGHLYLQMNRLPEAQRQVEAAIALEPNNPALHFLVGKVYHLEGQGQKAAAEFSTAAALNGYHSTPEK